MQRRADDPIGRYLRAVGPAPVLSLHREMALASQMVDGERDLLAAVEGAPALERAVADLAGRLVGTRDVARLGRRRLSVVLTALGKEGGPAADGPAFAAAMAAQARMAAAWNALLRANLRLVVSVARRHAQRGLDVIDLIQEGNIGLMKAIDRFDPRRNVRFATYAVWWIRQSIGKALLAQGRTIRIPSQIASTISEIASTDHDLTGRMGRAPTSNELAQRMDLPLERFQRMQTLPRKLLPLDVPLGPDDGGRVLADTVIPDEVVTPDQVMQKRTSLALAHVALGALLPEERALLVLRFGIDGGQPRSLRAVARQYQVSRDTVRRLEQRSLRKLSHDRDLRGLVDD
jgi:RNA polymerase primary sigma factor